MIDGLIPNRHETLVDDEKVEWIADVDDKVHSLIQKLLMEAMATNNQLKQEVAHMLMRTAGTREGKQADRVLDALRQNQEEGMEEDAVIDMPVKFQVASENAEKKKKKGWSI